MSRKLLAVVLTLVLAGWLLQGCGSSGAEMTQATASTLQGDVDKVASAADASRWEAAIEALDQLGSDVASAQAAGRLSDDRATQIRAVRQRVLEDLQRIRLSNPTPGPATTSKPPCQPSLMTMAATATGKTAAASIRTMTRAKTAAASVRARTRGRNR